MGEVVTCLQARFHTPLTSRPPGRTCAPGATCRLPSRNLYSPEKQWTLGADPQAGGFPSLNQQRAVPGRRS